MNCARYQPTLTFPAFHKSVESMTPSAVQTRFTRGRVRELKNGHNSVTVQNRTHVYMNFFHHKGLGNHLLQLCPKVVKHPVCFMHDLFLLLFQDDFFSCLIDFTLCCLETQSNPTHIQGYATTDQTSAQPCTSSADFIPTLSITTLVSVGILSSLKPACVLPIPAVLEIISNRIKDSTLQDVYELNIFSVTDAIVTKLWGLMKNKHVHTSVPMGRINKQIIFVMFCVWKKWNFF